MKKRAGLARALALDPKILFFDEPSAGLDPITSKRLDDLITELKESLGMTFVVISHELASIFDIADDAIFLDAKSKTLLDRGSPSTLLDESAHPEVVDFLTRNESSNH
jgi:phospholipid/cholesterol/gamma-HCH transport system ATP-binding protein